MFFLTALPNPRGTEFRSCVENGKVEKETLIRYHPYIPGYNACSLKLTHSLLLSSTSPAHDHSYTSMLLVFVYTCLNRLICGHG